FSMLVSNRTAGSDAYAATLTDTFAHLSNISYSSRNIYVPHGTVAISSPSGALADAGILSESINRPAGAVVQFSVTGTVGSDAGSALVNTATVGGVYDPYGPNNSA